MADITPPAPIVPTAPMDREKKREEQSFKPSRDNRDDADVGRDIGSRGHDPGDFIDVASVLGIPEDQLTPDVRRAITGLMAEVDDLRLKLTQSQEREAYYAEMADKDSVLPLLNHRAFVREIARILNLKWPEGIEHCLAYLDITNADRIKAEYGHMALEGALIHVALLLKAELRETDVLGNLAGNDFGIILTVSDGPGAAEKAASLKRVVETRPVAWVGKLIYLEAACGSYVLRRGDTPEAAIDAADQASRATALGDNIR